MKNAFKPISFLLLSLCWVIPAAAYIPPAEQLLGFMTDRLGPAHAFVVYQQTIVYDPAIEDGMEELAETLYFAAPDRFRSELVGPEVERVTVVGPRGALSVVDGRIVREGQHAFDHFKDLMLLTEADRSVEVLLKLGVDVDRVSLGRFENRIVYVIGAKYPDETVPQVWIDKATFRPLRFILEAGDEGAGKEVRYGEYLEKGNRGEYPGRMLFYENGELVRMHVVDAVETQTEISAELFDLNRIRDMYGETYGPSGVPAESPPGSTSELDDVKKSLEEFRRIFE